MNTITVKELDDWMAELFSAPLKNSVRYFWMEGINYQVSDGKLYAQYRDGNYYECSMLMPKRVRSGKTDEEVATGYTTDGIIHFLRR